MNARSFSTRVQVGPVFFDSCTFDDAVEDLLLDAANRSATGGTRLSNAWCVVMADRNADYASQLNGPGRTLPDGASVAEMLKRRTDSFAEQVRGPSLFRAALERGQDASISHYFLGATPRTLDQMESEAMRHFPRLRIAGRWAPPFGPISSEFLDEATARVSVASPGIVWVGMGSPKQDYVANALASRTGIPSVGVGAAFDFLAGTVREAPIWLQGSGFEWLFRLTVEPRRLWRRYLVGNLRFMYLASRNTARTARETRRV